MEILHPQVTICRSQVNDALFAENDMVFAGGGCKGGWRAARGTQG